MSRRPYIRPLPRASWYLGNARYRRYMLREVTCLLVAAYSVLLIWALAALGAGHARWDAFLTAQQSTPLAVFHAAALLYYLAYMTFDWFKLAPKAMPLQIGEKRLPAGAIVAAHYAAWLLVTAVVFWLAGVF